MLAVDGTLAWVTHDADGSALVLDHGSLFVRAVAEFASHPVFTVDGLILGQSEVDLAPESQPLCATKIGGWAGTDLEGAMLEGELEWQALLFRRRDGTTEQQGRSANGRQTRKMA